MKKRSIPIIIVTVIVLALLLVFLQKLMVPKYVEEVPEGSMIAEYYDHASDNDVVFFGDCEVYEVISPVTLWEDYGITSYVRGSAQQLVWQSYYLMEETLKYETPKVMVFNVCAMMHDDPDSTDDSGEREAYNRMTLDGMKWSSSKWNCINASMTTEEKKTTGMWTYIFPLLRFHDRWSELTPEDWKYLFHGEQVTDNGYLMQVGIRPVQGEYPVKPLVNYTFSDMCYDYLDKMTELCKAHDVQLVLMKAPEKYPIWYDQYEEQIETYAAEHGLPYFNLMECEAEYGLDWNTDTYDSGLHLNVYGVEKVTSYFGGILSDEFRLEDHRSDAALAASWEEKVSVYYDRKAALEADRAKNQ